MESRGVLLRRRIALSLIREDMDHDRLADPLRVLDRLLYLHGVVAVDRAKVGNPQLFKEHSGQEHRFDRIFGAADSGDGSRILFI